MELENAIDSREVAKMVGRNHKEVLRDIRNLISYLTSAKLQPVELLKTLPTSKDVINVADYFIHSEYLDAKKEYRPCYLITKIGCELYGTRMTGQKGIHFAIAYIDRFNQMEKHIQKEVTHLSSTKVQLKALLEHEEKLERLEEDVTDLKKEIDLTRIQKKQLSDVVKRNAMKAVGGKKSEAYKPFYKVAIAENWRSIKNYFDVASYEEIPRLRFEEAVELAESWSPSAELKMNIKKCLQQLQLM
ncbi:hypothetical protein A5886_002192 [Enterococcus sp. 8G7_MSG3316]|uniref:ORF6C domain-containing protein n=1 Tax=Candidatus Enterococcus testudinis TaxID=1834191 RepID=A0A242A834_9ENTE|nr:Rha family transcriptional regulator [Enterococcus sp. 8G7_MSG3316]OTN77112.1 hypothetical protein A5886_002192 [Enterococcus sp. 8G7_MSG3316]